MAVSRLVLGEGNLLNLWGEVCPSIFVDESQPAFIVFAVLEIVDSY